MKRYIKGQFLVLAALAASTATAWTQTPPGAPEANGLTPKSATSYINSQATDTSTINNGQTGNLGVAIVNGGNVVVGWEDDAIDPLNMPLQNLKGVWTLFDSADVSVLTNQQVSILSKPEYGILDTKLLSFFRADQSAVYGGTGGQPKIKANLFGDGFGMGISASVLGEDVSAFAAYDGVNKGDYPALQLLDNQGHPAGTLAGVSVAYATRDAGNIEIGDWDYLSNSNIVVVSESHQESDLVSVYSGSTAGAHVVFRIVSPTGTVIKPETLVSEKADAAESWYGMGVTANGFAVRFLSGGKTMVRMFDCDGNPVSTNLDIAALTGAPVAGLGGNGSAAGFHGNGKDAYVLVNTGTNASSQAKVWLTVLSTNGTVKYSKSVVDDLTLASAEKADAAISTNGEVIVVFSGLYDPSFQNTIMGRRFDLTGSPIGGTFYVSELELLDPMTPGAYGPRVAWRNGQVAVVWQSKNDPSTFDPYWNYATVVGLRLFSTFAVGSIETLGLKRIVADTPLIIPNIDKLGNWEPYAGVLGTSTFLVEGSTFAEGYELPSPDGRQRFVVALQPVDGSAMKLVEGFHADDGTPYKGPINASRQDGDPGRVCGDTRPGAVHYMVGAEASPHTVSPQFTSDDRWNLGFDRLVDGRYGTIQIYKLDTATLTPTPLCKALDSAHGRQTSGMAAGNQITRFGGEIVCLDNGNFVSVVEDRARVLDPDNDLVVATIFAPDGSVVKEAFIVARGDIWSNVAPFKGGFAVRAKPGDGSNTRLIYFFDNDGVLKGTVDQVASGASFDTGRGDGTRIFGHINSPYVFLAGRAANTQVVKVVAFDSRDQTFLAIADVNEGAFTGNFDRAIGAVDALNRLTVSWVSQPTGYANQQVAARVFAFDGTARKFNPLTPSFFAFVNVATNTIRSLQMSVAMTTKAICIAAKGEINRNNKPELGADTPSEVNFYTVISHPVIQEDPTTPVGGAVSQPTLKISVSGLKITLSWDASASGFTLECKSSLADAAWTTVGTANPTTLTIDGTCKLYRLRK
jgi:hypothetical protein